MLSLDNLAFLSFCFIEGITSLRSFIMPYKHPSPNFSDFLQNAVPFHVPSDLPMGSPVQDKFHNLLLFLHFLYKEKFYNNKGCFCYREFSANIISFQDR